MTFDELVAIEPGLNDLLEEARKISSKGNPNFCANRVWYKDFKPRLLRLVGWDAVDPRLKGHKAYDTAYTTIYEALPNCRHEGPIC